jgi:hypothetical protein
MTNLKLYCCTINHYKVLEKLPHYIVPVGLGQGNFPKNWLTDKTGHNISHLNSFYGEFTMFYWIWKNELKKMTSNDFIGTCHHRRLWLNKFYDKKQKFNISSLYSNLLNEKNNIFLKNDLIHLNAINFNKTKKSLYEDFCEIHSKIFLDEAISYLPQSESGKFRTYLDGRQIFPMNMFITKVQYFDEYCSLVFPWLEKCFEFGREKKLFNGYNIRLIAFLMERFTSYWYQRFSNRDFLSYARLGSFHLSNRLNNILSTINMPFTFLQYPTISRY